VSAASLRHPLLERLTTEYGFPEVTAETFDEVVAQAGHTLLFFTEDPVRYRETLDLAVILPELHRVFGGAFRAAVLMPEAAKQLHRHFGFRRWPAFVLLRDGEHVGAVEGVRNWDEYLGELQRLLAAASSLPAVAGSAPRSRELTGGCP
jgi:hydrogenase-1 operon protein HyaE